MKYWFTTNNQTHNLFIYKVYLWSMTIKNNTITEMYNLKYIKNYLNKPISKKNAFQWQKQITPY
ncbi:MAG: hypothetical protein CL840_04185 [Crocinitomicaceae bacterium]|nr:hypothetical protein [Crocinitomicaceae bacterium]